MQPIMMSKPSACAASAIARASVQPAGLVELDVDGVITVAKPVERGAGMNAFIGIDGDRPLHVRQRFVLAGRQQLLHQRHAKAAHTARFCARLAGLRPRWRRRSIPIQGAALRTAAIRPASPSPPKLDLEQRPVRGLGGGGRHRFRRR